VGELLTADFRDQLVIACRVCLNLLFCVRQGRKFGGAIIKFGEDAVNDFKDAFTNGAVSDLLKEGTEAFDESTDKALQSWNDGKFTLEDLSSAIDLVGKGVQLVADFIIAGITDLAAAIGGFFDSVGDALACAFGDGEW
jgi:hypothetical protein